MAELRAKMPPSQRAKQFAPFDAVVGLRQALKEKEKIRIPKKEISDDMEEEIDRTLKSLKENQIITVVWYSILEENYIQTTGRFKTANTIKKFIKIENIIISMCDIYSIVT